MVSVGRGLTANMQRDDALENEEGYSSDPEHEGATSRSKRRTKRYSLSPSPLKLTGTAMKSMSKTMRRVSLRVVNLAGTGLAEQIRLGDGEETARRAPVDDDDEPSRPDLSKSLPIRGRTLGFLGPDSKVRLWLFNFLVYPWTEPVILLLIVLNAVVLTIQAFPSLTLPTANGPTLPPHIQGYFHTWEDYALFALFVVFTLEAIARICVTGFLFDPEISVFSLFSSPYSLQSEPYPPNPGPTSGVGRQTSLTRGRSITQRISHLRRALMRPFVIAPHVPTSAYPMQEYHPSPTTTPQLQRNDTVTGRVRNAAHRAHATIREPAEPTYLSRVMKSETVSGDPDAISLPFSFSIGNLHDKTQRNVPYLRQSWSRIDFVAILSFWIMFGLAMAGIEKGTYHVGIFRAMSVIRTARLLTITSGTTTILHSLKTARPLLTSVAYFVLFAMVLFSIIGVQSFNGSFRRSCILSPTLGEAEILLQDQFCGGYIDPVTFERTGYIDISNNTFPTPKGYICPLGQLCKETVNPKHDIESFDAIHYAALQVLIVASANGWAPMMYSMIDAEFFVSCFFFILAIIVLNFWLINLFVAVITHTFAAIRSTTSKSAFGAAPLVKFDKQDDDWLGENGRKAATRPNTAKVIYEYTKWCWVILALASLGLQASKTVDMSESQKLALYYGELGITIAFDIEIVLRVFATLPHWRTFFQHGNNWLDTILAIGSTIIQLPAIRHSELYPWFTIFQLARFYRVILVVPRMRPLLLAVFGNMYGLANMSLFLFLINYIAALVAVQLLRGDFGNNTTINFGEAFNAFLAMYQVFSSENWPDVLYGAAQAEIQLRQTAIVIIFVSGWMIFANFIVLQMFIAVINENFEVAEEAKKGKQATHYLNQNQAEQASSPWLRRLNPYRWVKANPVTVKVENLPSNLVLPMQKALIQDFGAQRREPRPVVKNNPVLSKRFKPGHYSSKSLTALQKLFAGEVKSGSTMATLRHARQEPSADPYDEEIERHLELLASVNPDAGLGENAEDEYYERKALRADFIRNHPTYDKVFGVISQKNWVRQLCQQVVQPPKRERIFGKPYSPIALPIFQMAILLTVIGGIAVESVATPLYRRHYYATHGLVRGAWFDVAESVFGLVLFLEFMIKVIADGFLITPNAYLRSIWNFIDFLIMIGIIVNVTTGIIFIGGLTRITRSLKALRALRLITLIDHMRNTFESLIISGAVRILDAAVLAILYMIPYAVWGLNIFAGRMNTCNDRGAIGMADCINEYPNTIVDNNSFGFPVPRVWDNPSPSTSFSFDSFRASLLILFEIVSLEGWIDVMSVAMSITGKNEQPQTNASQANAIFFVIYNLLGGVVILTLFVSIIINNFSSKTGTAFLTNAQREWIDLQKLFRRQRPSKRPKVRPTTPFRSWCFDRAVHKHGWWTRAMTLLFLLHILALMTQTFTVHEFADKFRNDFFLGLMSIYILDVVVRWYGLGWRSFRANGWNLFDIVVSIGSFITTLIVRFGGSRGSGFGIQQLQKLFLVSIAFKLVQRTNSLNMLFKTAVASLPVIINLLGLWLILFIFFAILFVEVFGLTKWGSAENRSANYESLGSALVMLAFQSTGEGWNQYMHDFDLTYPRCTNSSKRKAESDCGSTAWAFALFIAWNLLSMYIFVNMFTGVVVENFSYVFQASGSGAKSISREQMRSFKKVWAELSNPKTGYLERQNFTAFFGKLSGIFEVRVYPAEYSVRNILSVCTDPLGQDAWSPRVVSGVDLSKVEKILDGIDYNEIRKRRAIYCRLYHEATISHEPGLGISFTNMLTLLAHHKLIVDAEALVLEDLVARTETIKLVTDLVNLDRVRSLLKAISERKKFLEYREQKRAARLGQEIPSIVVEDMPETPPLSSRDIASASFESPSQTFSAVPRLSHHDVSFSMDIPTGSRLQRSRRPSDYSMFSADSFRSARSSMAEEDPQDIVNSMQNSMWGDLMMEAAEEEKKRHNS